MFSFSFRRISFVPCLRRQFSTIFSLSSGFGKSGVAVIRVSGPSTLNVIQQMTSIGDAPRPRYAYYKTIHFPSRPADILDKGLVLWFPAPHSFTGEDCCEFQVHGGPAIIRSVLHALATLPHCRPAEPGEFTRRAFHSGKLDLTEVEGLADLIHAETEMQRKQALLQANGALGQLYTRWRTQLVQSIAHFEAFIDFSEDENIEDDVVLHVQQMVTELATDIERHLDVKHGERIRSGVRAVIVGEPNVGKSSLLNLLCQRSVAIVTDVPGTTRDVLETSIDIGGYPMILMDTAGLRAESEADRVEQEGMLRAKEHARTADLVIVLCSAQSLMQAMQSGAACTAEEYATDYVTRLGIDGMEGKRTVVAINKMDLINNQEDVGLEKGDRMVGMSCKTNDGLKEVIARIEKELQLICGGAEPTAECPNLSQTRHRFLLTECLESLRKFLINLRRINEGHIIDLAITAAHLRQAVRSLGKMTGEVTAEDVLDVIFKDFCIGK